MGQWGDPGGVVGSSEGGASDNTEHRKTCESPTGFGSTTHKTDLSRHG